MTTQEKINIVEKRILDCLHSPNPNPAVLRALRHQKMFLELYKQLPAAYTDTDAEIQPEFKLVTSKQEVSLVDTTNNNLEGAYRGLKQNYTVTYQNGISKNVTFLDANKWCKEQEEIAVLEQEITNIKKQLEGLSTMNISAKDKADLQTHYQKSLKKRKNRKDVLTKKHTGCFNQSIPAALLHTNQS